MTADELLERLLELTPLPPNTTDIDQLLAAAAQMLEARQTALASAGGGIAVASRPERVAELARREAAWRDALAAAQQAVGQQRVATAKLRKYAPMSAR